jgi:hypothetical protein
MIYSEHIKECNTFSQQSPANLKRSCLFVLATIQQQLETVPVALTDIVSLAEGSRFAWGPKLAGVTWLESETRLQLLFDEAHTCICSPAELLDVFLQVPGFALVKAGFMCQIFAGSVGCIDTHNVKLYGITRGDTRYEPASPDTMKRKRERYVSLCDGLGGSHALWSRWCDYVASVRPFNWTDGREVSQFHVDVITGREDGAVTDLFTGLEYEPTFRQEV